MKLSESTKFQLIHTELKCQCVNLQEHSSKFISTPNVSNNKVWKSLLLH